jgi:hypothetical protein
LPPNTPRSNNLPPAIGASGGPSATPPRVSSAPTGGAPSEARPPQPSGPSTASVPTFVGRILTGVTEFFKGVTDVIVSVLSRA